MTTHPVGKPREDLDEKDIHSNMQLKLQQDTEYWLKLNWCRDPATKGTRSYFFISHRWTIVFRKEDPSQFIPFPRNRPAEEYVTASYMDMTSKSLDKLTRAVEYIRNDYRPNILPDESWPPIGESVSLEDEAPVLNRPVVSDLLEPTVTHESLQTTDQVESQSNLPRTQEQEAQSYTTSDIHYNFTANDVINYLQTSAGEGSIIVYGNAQFSSSQSRLQPQAIAFDQNNQNHFEISAVITNPLD